MQINRTLLGAVCTAQTRSDWFGSKTCNRRTCVAQHDLHTSIDYSVLVSRRIRGYLFNIDASRSYESFCLCAVHVMEYRKFVFKNYWHICSRGPGRMLDARERAGDDPLGRTPSTFRTPQKVYLSLPKALTCRFSYIPCM